MKKEFSEKLHKLLDICLENGLEYEVSNRFGGSVRVSVFDFKGGHLVRLSGICDFVYYDSGYDKYFDDLFEKIKNHVGG